MTKIGLWLYVIVVILASVFYGARGACVVKGDAVKAVENMGFTDVEVLDKSIWFVGFRGCDKADAALVEVQAKNSAGKVVNVDVCMGWPFKGATVRSP